MIITSIAMTTWLAPRLRARLNRSREEYAYRQLLAACASTGQPRLASEGPLAHAQRVARRLPTAAKDLEDGLKAWLDVRYSAPGIPVQDARQRLLTAAKAVRRAAKIRRAQMGKVVNGQEVEVGGQ